VARDGLVRTPTSIFRKLPGEPQSATIPIDLPFARCRRTGRTGPLSVLVRVGRVADFACTGVPGPHATGLFLTTRLVATDDAGRQFRGGHIVTHGAEGRWPLTRGGGSRPPSDLKVEYVVENGGERARWRNLPEPRARFG
jgi:hypothetical protein